MVFFKLVTRFNLISFLLLGLAGAGYSQGCNGDGGTGITGGAISTNPGFLCANLDALGGPGSSAEITITAGNVFSTDAISFSVNWDDGLASPITPAVVTGPKTRQLVVNHVFPTTGPNVKCEYVPRVTLFVNGSPCFIFGSSPKFTRWNVDNENSGRLELSETVSSANTYLVCKGSETTVTFTDRSTLNCMPPDYGTYPFITVPINIQQRWRRFTYGTLNTVTSATGVEVDNAVRTYPYQGNVETENPSLAPLNSPNTLQIKIPADAQVGEEFEITMEYWNTCNPFPGAPVTQTARIIIIDLPDKPIVLDNEICFGDLGATTLSVTNVQSNVDYKWYSSLPDAQSGSGELNIGNTFTPTSSQASVGVNHFFVVGTWGTNSCASAIEDVVLTLRENIDAAPIKFSGDPDVCPNGDRVYTLQDDPAVEPFGGATEYLWTLPTGWTFNSGEFTKSVSVHIGGSLGNKQITVVRRYVTATPSGSQCESQQLFIPIVVHANPSVAPADVDICEGTSQIIDGNPNPVFGTITQHEWTGSTSILNSTSIQAPTILATATPNTYSLTYKVTNSISCSGSASVLVNISTKATAGTDQLLCQVTSSNPLGASDPAPFTGKWTVVVKPLTSVTQNFSDINDFNAIFTADVFGRYILRWKVGGCYDDMLVDFGSTVAQPTATAKQFCGLSGAMDGNAPTFELGTWSKISGPGNISFDDIHLPTATVTASAYGLYQLKWEFTSGSGTGSCSTKSVLIDVMFSEPTISKVPADFTTCVDQTLLTPIDLKGKNLVVGGATNGQWQIVSGLGTIQSTGGSTGLSFTNGTLFGDRYIPVAGETVVKVRMVAQHPDAGAPCPNVNSPDLTITIDIKPDDAFAGSDFSVCDGTMATFSADAPTSGGSGVWSFVSGPDSAPVFGNVTNPGSSVSVNQAGNYVYRWTVRSALFGTTGACATDGDDVSLTVRPLPTINNILANVCQTELLVQEAHNVVLSGYDNDVIAPEVAADRMVKWYAKSTDRDTDSSPITLTTDLTVSDNIRYMRVIDTTVPAQLCVSLGEATFSIKPNIIVNAVSDKPEMCSGETVTVISSTLGGTSHKWFYREVSNPSVEFDMRGPSISPTTQRFVITNNSTAAIPYEIVYQATNGFCPKEMVLPITVYPAVTAGLDTLSVTKYSGGNAFANFINTSSPLDDNVFRYDWDFDDGAVPQTLDAITPPMIRYTTLNQKTIQLTVTNKVAEANNLICSSTASMTIFIKMPALEADFNYALQTMCSPAEIAITENLGTGDIYKWALREVNSTVPLLESNLTLPIFKVNVPGFYVIEFTTINSITGQRAVASNSATPIEIFDKPLASFELRTKTVYVPDDNLIIINRSTNAEQYDWDFGDGQKSMDSEPSHAYAEADTYTVTLVASFNHGPKDLDNDGVMDGDLICYDTARQDVTAKEGGLTRIPNAFTPSTSGPNGGISGGGTFNDTFRPITKGVEEFEMDIYDRWGSLVFQSKDKNRGWDGYDKNGILLPAGVYVYKLTMRLSNDQRTTQVGDVTLIR